MFRIGAVAVCICGLLASGWGQECTAVLGAVRDISTGEGSRSHYSSFKRFFCDQTFSQYGQARDAGLELKIPIDDLPVSFKGHDKSSNWSEYQHSVCESIDTFDSLDVTWKNYLAKANTSVVEAWSSCVNALGLHFWAEVNEDNPRALTLVAKYVSSGPPFTTRISSPLTSLGSRVKCPPSAFKAGSISSAEKRADCSRADGAVATNLTLHTVNGDRTIRLLSSIGGRGDEIPPSLRDNIFTPNATINVDTNQGVFAASHTAPLAAFPIGWTGPNMGHPPLGTFAKALYKVDLLAPAPSQDHLAETISIQSDVGGKCGAAASGGSGGVNPEWTTTIELPRRRTARQWKVHLTSAVSHRTQNPRCSVALEGRVIDLSTSGQSEADLLLEFGEHVFHFSCTGRNPYNGCYGHANGINEHFENMTYNWTIEASPAQEEPPKAKQPPAKK